MSLLGRTLRGVLWTFANSQVLAALAFAVSLVAARELSTNELGTYALATSVVGLVGGLCSLQAGNYFIVAPEGTARLLRSGVTLELSIGATVLFLLTVGTLISVAAGASSRLASLIIVSGLVLVTNPFGGLQHWYGRHLRYHVPTLAQGAAAAVAAITKIALVLAGLQAWGLVIGDVVLSAVFAILMVMLVPEGRGLLIDRELMRQQIAFGVPSLLSGFFAGSFLRIQELVVAAVLGTRQLGYLYIAARLPNQIYFLWTSLSVPLLSAFSRADDERLERAFATTVRLSAFLVALPVALAPALAEPFVVFLFGEKWRPAGTPLALLLAALAVRFVLLHGFTVLKSRRRVKEITILLACQFAATGVAVYIGAQIGGLAGAMAGGLVVELLTAAPKVWLVRKVVPLAVWPAVRMPLVALVLTMAATVGVAQALSGGAGDFAAAAVGTGVWLAVLWLGDREVLRGLGHALTRPATTSAAPVGDPGAS